LRGASAEVGDFPVLSGWCALNSPNARPVSWLVGWPGDRCDAVDNDAGDAGMHGAAPKASATAAVHESNCKARFMFSSLFLPAVVVVAMIVVVIVAIVILVSMVVMGGGGRQAFSGFRCRQHAAVGRGHPAVVGPPASGALPRSPCLAQTAAAVLHHVVQRVADLRVVQPAKVGVALLDRGARVAGGGAIRLGARNGMNCPSPRSRSFRSCGAARSAQAGVVASGSGHVDQAHAGDVVPSLSVFGT